MGDVVRSKTTRKVKSVSAADLVTVTKKVLVLALRVHVSSCWLYSRLQNWTMTERVLLYVFLV